MLGRPDRIEAERFNELAHVEGVIHVCGVRDRRWAGVVLLQQTLPVALVVTSHHHPTVHACAPLPLVIGPVVRDDLSPWRGPHRRLSAPARSSYRNANFEYSPSSAVMNSNTVAWPPSTAARPRCRAGTISCGSVMRSLYAPMAWATSANRPESRFTSYFSRATGNRLLS